MGPCLYCLTENGEPSVEHVVPLGLGEHADIVLPADAVCAACNNWLGEQVDEPLIQLAEIRIIRGLYQVPNRKGAVVDHIELAPGTGTLEFTPDGSVRFHLYVPAGEPTPKYEVGETYTETIRPARGGLLSQRRRTARALIRMGLGLVYLEYGPAEALSPKFDPTRAYLLGAGQRHALLLGALDINVPPDFDVSVRRDVPGVPIAIEFRYGGWSGLTPLALSPDPAPAELRAWADEHDWQIYELQAKSEPKRMSDALRRLVSHPRLLAADWLQVQPIGKRRRRPDRR